MWKLCLEKPKPRGPWNWPQRAVARMSLIPRNAAEMPTAASRASARLPSRGLLFDHYQGKRLDEGKGSIVHPVKGISALQDAYHERNEHWQDEALKNRATRFENLAHRKGVFQSTIPSVLECKEEKEGWLIVKEGDNKVHYLEGEGTDVYDLVFGYLKKHDILIHLLCYDNAMFRSAKRGWDGKFKGVGLDLVDGELRVIMGERGLGIVKGDASAVEEVQSEVTELSDIDALSNFVGQRFSPVKLGHELKVDEKLLMTVAEEKAKIISAKRRGVAREQRDFLRRLKKLEGRRKIRKKKSAISPEKAYISNLTGVVRLNRPTTRTFDNEMSWKVRNDWQIKKPNYESPGHPSKSSWLREGEGEVRGNDCAATHEDFYSYLSLRSSCSPQDLAKRIAEERRIDKLVEKKGELSLAEEENALTLVRRESTFRMSRLRNGFVSGSLEKQKGIGRQRSKAGWGDFEAAGKERFKNTSNFNIRFTPKAKPVEGKGGGDGGGAKRRRPLVMTKTPKSNADVFFK